jgi:hypothetical protein
MMPKLLSSHIMKYISWWLTVIWSWRGENAFWRFGYGNGAGRHWCLHFVVVRREGG